MIFLSVVFFKKVFVPFFFPNFSEEKSEEFLEKILKVQKAEEF